MDGSKILSMLVESLFFLDSLNFLPMSLKNKPKSLDLSFKKGYDSHFFNRPRIWIMWAPIPKLIIMGQTICQVMSEQNFWHGMRSKKVKISIIRKNSWPTARTTSMY
jgi:hypothetical protein